MYRPDATVSSSRALPAAGAPVGDAAPGDTATGDAAPGARAPRLHGARARAGMVALAQRLEEAGLRARVFGHPVAAPPGRDVFVAAVATVLAGVVGAVAGGTGPFPGLLALLLTAGVGLGVLQPWPRRAAWAVVVGSPSPATRVLRALALDDRRPRPWMSVVVGAAAAVLVVFPGAPWAVALAVGVALWSWYDPVRPRAIGLDEAVAWARGQPHDEQTVLLVGTGVAGTGEGIVAVLDWHAVPGRAVRVVVDEAQPGRTARRLDALGIGAAPSPKPSP